MWDGLLPEESSSFPQIKELEFYRAWSHGPLPNNKIYSALKHSSRRRWFCDRCRSKGLIEADYLTIKSKSYNLNSPGIRNETTKLSSRVSSPIMTSITRFSLKFLDLKASFSSNMKVKLDFIELYDFENKKNRIKDSEDLKSFLWTLNGASNFLVFYYKLGIKTIIVEVEYFQNNIDKIIVELSLDCSIYMLKNLIAKKLQMEEISVSEFLIYFSNTAQVKSQNKSQRQISQIGTHC
jgi:hypothetical protein